MPQTFYGVFFEDINYSADGGLYAELVQNRSFEYNPEEAMAEIGGGDTNQHINALMVRAYQMTPLHSWTEHSRSDIIVKTENPLNANNPHYLEMINRGHENDFVLKNHGYGGMPISKDAVYNFSFFAKRTKPQTAKPFLIELETPSGEIIASSEIKGVGKDWGKHETVLKASESCPNARLVLRTSGSDVVNLDMVSLIPQETFKNRKNGLRKDLAESIANLNPKFLRFPGGCLVHGRSINNAYRWEDTVGPLEERKEKWNRWGYFQSYGLGFFEYFQLCEDMEAEPLPCLPMGITPDAINGKQHIVPMNEMKEWVDSVLNLIEFANGGVDTKWGSLRAKMGHPKPFNLKYVGIGNEEGLWTEMKERHVLIQDAVKEKYPNIKIIGSLGPVADNIDWYKFLDSTDTYMGDEHYYNSPEWYFDNADRFDRYPKGKTKIFIGEYASLQNTLKNAVSEAAYLTGAERNADFVEMTCYAPLLARYGNIQWGANLIFFNNTKVVKTPNYYMLEMFGNNLGDEYLKNTLKKDSDSDKIYASVTLDKSKREIILKLVNGENRNSKLKLDLKGATLKSVHAKGVLLTGNATDVNDINAERISPVAIEVNVSKEIEMPAMSVQVLKVPVR